MDYEEYVNKEYSRLLHEYLDDNRDEWHTREDAQKLESSINFSEYLKEKYLMEVKTMEVKNGF